MDFESSVKVPHDSKTERYYRVFARLWQQPNVVRGSVTFRIYMVIIEDGTNDFFFFLMQTDTRTVRVNSG